MRKKKRRFRGNALKRAIAVHGLQQPALGLASLVENRNKILLALQKYAGREQAPVKSGLYEADFIAIRVRGKFGLPLPNVVVADKMRAQLDSTNVTFVKRDRLEPGQKNVAVNRFDITRRGGKTDVIHQNGFKPNSQAVADGVSSDRQFDSGFRWTGGAVQVVEHVPTAQLGSHVLRLQMMLVQRVQGQGTAGG